MKAYVVVKNNFRYNDECYLPTEGSTPVEVYRTMKRAKEEALIKTVSWLKSNDLSGYGYSVNEVFVNPELVEALLGVSLYKYWYENDFRLLETMSDDDKTAFVENILERYKPYKVVEVELKD